MVVAFLTKHGTPYAHYREWTALSIQLAQKIWWNYLANDVALPAVSMETLERHLAANQEYMDNIGSAARDEGFDQVLAGLRSRPQRRLRTLVIATLFDATQTRTVGPHDKNEDPELVRDQNHVHALLGAVLEAFDEIGVAGPQPEEVLSVATSQE